MATVATIRADLIGSSASFRAEMINGARQANTSLASIQAEVRRTSDSVRSLSTTAAGFVGFEAIKSSISTLLDAQKAVQSIHYTLLSATGSGATAEAAYNAVSQTADKLGIDLQTAEKGFASLSAAATANGVTMTDQQALFNGLARSATVLHLSTDTTGRAVTALSQIFSKGKIQAEELRQQLGDAIPGVVPRFQTAVLAMTQGTNLAGKSFDQLLQSGDLTVSRFLPALIEALNETGRGAEQASSGLNAETNRLSTAWFKLKSDLSGGLFDDAATASVRLMAQNLDHIAASAGVVGGLVLSRFAGQGLGKGADLASTAYQKSFLGPAQAADAESAYAQVAQGAATAAAADVKAAEAALARNAAWQASAAASSEASRDALAVAFANNEAAQATIAHQASTLTLSANIRASRDAMAAAVVAQRELTQAQTNYDAAIASGNVAVERQLVPENQLIRAREAEVVATNAAAAASARAAEATAASGLGATLARGASSLGSFALSLAGGPWGAAIAGIGGVAYAIYDLQKKSEDYRNETAEQVKSLEDLRSQLQAAAKDYGDLHSKMNLSQGIDLYTTSGANLSKQRDDLAALQEQADKLRESISARAGSGNPYGGGNGAADFFDERKLAEVTQRIADLEAQLPSTTAAANDLGTKLSGSMAPGIDAVKGAIDRLRAGASLGDIFAGWSSDITAGIAAVNAARDKTNDDMNALATAAKGWQKKADDVGKTPSQIAQAMLQNVINDIKSQKLAGDAQAQAIADARKDAAPHLASADSATAAEAAKKNAEDAKAAAKQQAEAYATVQRQIQDRINQDTDATNSSTKLTDADRLRVTVLNDITSGHLKLSPAEEKHIKDMLDQAEAAGKARVAEDQMRASLALTAALQERIDTQLSAGSDQNAIDVAGVGHGQQLVQQLQDQLRIRQSYAKQVDQLNRDANKPENQGTTNGVGGDGYNQRLALLSTAQSQELALYRTGVQQRLDAESDWENGAQAALENYYAAAADVAGATQTLFSNAFDSMGDAIATFATTGKLNFKGLVTSVLSDLAKMETRIAASQILQSILGAFGGGGAGDVSGLGGSASSYSSLAGVSDGSYSGGFNFASVSGGRANGGPVAAASMYEVAEGGKPELLSSGGRTYLMTGKNGGSVTPATSGSGGGSGTVINVAVTVNADGSADASATDDATGLGKRLASAIADGARQVIAQEKRTGGMLWQGRNKS